MTVEKYFEKNGYIYGVSSVNQFGWEHRVFKFTDLEKARKWLNTETYCFAERELMSKTAAEKLAGKDAFKDIKDFD